MIDPLPRGAPPAPDARASPNRSRLAEGEHRSWDWLALPVLLSQVWGFFAPVLEPKAQRGVQMLTAFAGALVVAGVAFGYDA